MNLRDTEKRSQKGGKKLKKESPESKRVFQEEGKIKVNQAQ